jgi:acyl carrier protein
MSCNDNVKRVLADSLQLGERVRSFTPATRLLGSLPELDSMAVITVISALEEHFGFTVNDDEISAETFETFGKLCEFVEQKLKA